MSTIGQVRRIEERREITPLTLEQIKERIQLFTGVSFERTEGVSGAGPRQALPAEYQGRQESLRTLFSNANAEQQAQLVVAGQALASAKTPEQQQAALESYVAVASSVNSEQKTEEMMSDAVLVTIHMREQ